MMDNCPLHGFSQAEKIYGINTMQNQILLFDLGMMIAILLLFMSGYTANVIAHQGILDDGVAFIQKPFSMAEMTEKLRKVLETASGNSFPGLKA
ncbi:MAG: hypothetical protein R6V54_13155 [Desulfobacteraceae bacterium]